MCYIVCCSFALPDFLLRNEVRSPSYTSDFGVYNLLYGSSFRASTDVSYCQGRPRKLSYNQSILPR